MKKIILICLCIGLLPSCSKPKPSIDIFDIINGSENIPESVTIKVVTINTSFPIKADEIPLFSTQLKDGKDAYRLLPKNEKDRFSHRKKIGHLEISENDAVSEYQLYQMKDNPNYFALRINDSTKGGGAILFFKGFQFNGKSFPMTQ